MWFLKKERNVQILLIYLVSFFVFSDYSMLDNTETIVSNPLIKDWSAHYTLDSDPKPKNPWEGWPEIPREQAMSIIIILHFICIFILIDDSITVKDY
jgi:hypothetical protein